MEIVLYKTMEICLSSTLDLNPKDYLNYPTEERLKVAIKDKLEDVMKNNYNFNSNPNLSFCLRENVDVINSDSSLDIPDEFISEWKKLKSDKNKQIINMEVTLTRNITLEATISLDLEPEDYLYCNTEEELRINVENDLQSSEDFTYSDSGEIKELDYVLHIPNKFIEEWKELKLNKNN